MPIGYDNLVMTAHSIRKSFLVRVDRFDPRDGGRLSGTVEAIDGSGATAPFGDPQELGSVLARFLATQQEPFAGNIPEDQG